MLLLLSFVAKTTFQLLRCSMPNKKVTSIIEEKGEKLRNDRDVMLISQIGCFSILIIRAVPGDLRALSIV